MRGWLLFLALSLHLTPVQAHESATVCFNYGCLVRVAVLFPEDILEEAAVSLRMADTPVEERGILAQVMGRWYRWAGLHTPIAVDRPGDFLDDGVHGMMDCIDHAETTTGFLEILAKRGLLRFHEVDRIHRRVRWLFAQHFSAVIREKQSNITGEGSPLPRFVVDTWFGEHGDPAVVLPLEDWMDGEGPNVS
ncbi:hypothetical protein [Zoogloea sp.]|uniref:hypothetical protein n=1 Tax=Zoogloea sp. TaxID=49181 RepID=UPI002611DA3A|nr:hypothetical protein [Zoogloea sp.]MDD3354432.1 hypothetical protein [Zoogloea sp.]